MIVQPAPIGPGARRRRGVRIVALGAPALLLGGVIALGALGPRGTDDGPASARPVASAPVVARASAAPSEPPASPPAVVPPAEPVFPRSINGSDVHGVEWTLEARNRGRAFGILAVAGYLALHPDQGGCDAEAGTPLADACARTAILSAEPFIAGSGSERTLPPWHLHPQLPPGVPLPFASTIDDPGEAARAAIVLARFDDPRARPCVPEGRHCGQELVVERVVWLDGEPLPHTAVSDAAAAAGDAGAP